MRTLATHRIAMTLTLVLTVGLVGMMTGSALAEKGAGSGDQPLTGPLPPNNIAPPVENTSASVATFRIDSGPDLDFYQPCNGGDNQIIFSIDVQNVDLATVETASLTMAVWDVDFACSGSTCERDTVSFNGTALTSPTAFLTGANNQWSSVSFNVDPTIIAEGPNQVFVAIDTLGGGWCVTVDWAELRLNLGEPPQIKEIKISPQDPMTLHDVTIEAEIENKPGYTVESVDWSITDKKTGAVETVKTDENPWTHKPAKGKHGQKTVTCTLSYKNDTSGETGLVQKSKDFKLFFEKNALSNPSVATSEPNWFKYWKRDGAVPGMSAAKYDPAAGGYGYATGNDIYLCRKGGGQHYTNAITLTTHFGTESFGGPSVKGIDCAAEVIAHENYHVWVTDQWKTGGSFNGKTDSDDGTCTGCDDRLPDFYETATSHTANNDTDTYDLEHKKSAVYKKYGDEEYMAMRAGDAARGTPEKDWANPGKQTTLTQYGPVVTARVVAYAGPTEAAQKLASGFGGTFTDAGSDTNGNSLYDVLTIGLDVIVDADGVYDVAGTLSAGATVIGSTTATFDLTAGTTTVELDFPGLPINAAGLDGPYSFHALLTDEDGEANYGETNPDYMTSAYLHTAFEGAQASYTGNCASHADDTDTDGSDDVLVACVDINVAAAGDYTVGAHLVSEDDDTVLGFAETTVPLAAGTQQVCLEYDGLPIGITGKDAPYRLMDATLVDVGTGTQVDYVDAMCTLPGYTAGQFLPPKALFNDTYADQGLDKSGDPHYEALAVDVGVDVTVDGTYILSGGIYDSNDTQIGLASIQEDLTAGSQTMRLEFNGEAIYQNAVDGPYFFRHPTLYGSDGSLVHLAGNVHTTGAYAYTEFRQGVEIIGNYTDTAVDDDTDGIYDHLDVTFDVLPASSGTYNANARIMDAANNEIVWASTSASLTGDVIGTLMLSFDGAAIGANGANGPYMVRDLYVYKSNDPAQSDYIYDAYATGPYSVVDFGGDPPPPPPASGGVFIPVNSAQQTRTINPSGTTTLDISNDAISVSLTILGAPVGHAVAGECGSNTHGFAGLAPGGSGVVGEVLTIESDLPDGSFAANIVICYEPSVLDAAGLTAADLVLHTWDEDQQMWVPVGTNSKGESLPTAKVGDYGWLGNCVWASVDHFSDFMGADLCPDDPDKSEPGACGCGVPDDDTDGDGVLDCQDNCPNTANADQADTDGNGVGDACTAPPVDTGDDDTGDDGDDDTGQTVPDDTKDDAPVDDDTATPMTPVCGAGTAQMALFGLAGLMLLRGGRRRRGN